MAYGFMDRVRQAKENYRQESLRKAQTLSLQNKLDLEDFKEQRQTLEARKVVEDQLRSEQRAVRDLKHPVIAKVREKFKEAGAAGLARLKTSARTGYGRVKAHVDAKNLAGSNPFGASVGNSPFAPNNAHRLSGAPKTLTKNQKPKVTKVVYYKR